MDQVGHPLEPLQSPLILLLLIEARRGRHLARESIIRRLSSGETMQIHDNVQACITRPPAQLLDIVQTALREVLALINEVLAQPVSDRNTDSVEAVAHDLGDVFLGRPAAPVARKGAVGLVLAQRHDAVELGLGSATAHVFPGTFGNPGLEDELRAEIDTADLALGRGE